MADGSCSISIAIAPLSPAKICRMGDGTVAAAKTAAASSYSFWADAATAASASSSSRVAPAPSSDARARAPAVLPARPRAAPRARARAAPLRVSEEAPRALRRLGGGLRVRGRLGFTLGLGFHLRRRGLGVILFSLGRHVCVFRLAFLLRLRPRPRRLAPRLRRLCRLNFLLDGFGRGRIRIVLLVLLDSLRRRCGGDALLLEQHAPELIELRVMLLAHPDVRLLQHHHLHEHLVLDGGGVLPRAPAAKLRLNLLLRRRQLVHEGANLLQLLNRHRLERAEDSAAAATDWALLSPPPTQPPPPRSPRP